MNVFEDLIEELKDENLIEDSIFDLEPNTPVMLAASVDPSAGFENRQEHVSNGSGTDEMKGVVSGPPENQTDAPAYFQKRAMDEIASLQMVDHIFSGVERDQLKRQVTPFDDLDAKKALHKFLQVTEPADSDEFRDAHQALLAESEAWFSALVERDEKMSVADLRRFCETSRPVLSSQALISLARFYRNAPFNELIRSKFDYLLTRLFSRELGDEKRRMICGRMDIPTHINKLYSRWSSLNIYDSEEYAELIREHVSAISVYAAEVEASQSLDALIESGVFVRVQQAKEQLADLFFSPEVAAAVIDSNLRIGNRFVDLATAERDSSLATKLTADKIVELDGLVSQASGKTFCLEELLIADDARASTVAAPSKKATPGRYSVPDFERAERSETSPLLKVNKWLLAVTLLVVMASVGVYFWADSQENAQTSTSVAPVFNVQGSGIESYLSSAKRTSETMYGVTSGEWDTLADDRKKEVLQKALTFASGSGIDRVQFIDKNGRTKGFASQSRVEVFNDR